MSQINIFYSIIFLINIFFFYNLNKISRLLNLYDTPDSKRKIHKIKTPLIGGVIIMITILAYFFFVNFFFQNNQFYNYNILTSLILIFFVGLVDDKTTLSSNTKTILFILIILFTIYTNQNLQIIYLKFSFLENTFSSNNYSIFFSVFCVFVFINAFNMFDGIDGQSGIYAVILFSYFIYKEFNIILSISLIITFIFFLIFNLKSKIFLGDNGSIVISFLISLIVIDAYNTRIIKNCDEIFILMMLPGIDMARLFIERVYKKKNPLIADNRHLHHLLMKKYSIHQVLLINTLLVFLPILLMILGLNELYIILIFLSIYSLLIFSFNK
jgi:UDP-GlcNAc:undecaprenyl-phosphate GlcNAc-1-phosphate transferase